MRAYPFHLMEGDPKYYRHKNIRKATVVEMQVWQELKSSMKQRRLSIWQKIAQYVRKLKPKSEQEQYICTSCGIPNNHWYWHCQRCDEIACDEVDRAQQDFS